MTKTTFKVDDNRKVKSFISKVRIAPYDYSVQYDDNLSAAAAVLGVCMADTSVILIDPTSSRQVMWETLLHEVLHGIWTQTPLDTIYTSEQEEQIIYCMTPRIVALLQDNPELVELLCGA